MGVRDLNIVNIISFLHIFYTYSLVIVLSGGLLCCLFISSKKPFRKCFKAKEGRIIFFFAKGIVSLNINAFALLIYLMQRLYRLFEVCSVIGGHPFLTKLWIPLFHCLFSAPF